MIEAIIDGRSFDRAAILAWEGRRMVAMRRKFGLPPSQAPIETQRRELLEAKLALGHDGLRAMLSGGLKWSERIARISAAMAGDKRKYSICELAVSEGSAEHFARWFDDRNNLDDEAAMLDAYPDHYIIARDVQGRQLVVETTGGSPLPSEFTVDYDDLSSLRSLADPAYPYQVAGVARLHDGLAIGGVRHQFRQEGVGFRALLTVEFPSTMLGYMIAQHRWHLACEFSNWIEAAAKAKNANGRR